MEGLFCSREKTDDSMRFHLLRFYDESGYVIAKSITGDDKKYIAKELRNFKLENYEVKYEPEYTFCGSFSESGSELSCKVENQIMNPADTWIRKDVLSFKGKIVDGTELHLTQSSKVTLYTVDRVYHKVMEEDILGTLS